MTVAIFDSHDFERETLNEANNESQYELKSFELRLTKETARETLMNIASTTFKSIYEFEKSNPLQNEVQG